MPIYVTEQGLRLLHNEVAKIEAELVKVREEKNIAYNLSGDTWHDNPGFNALEQFERRKAEELSDLRTKIADAVLCQTQPRPIVQVRIGSIVRCSRYFEKTDTTSEDVWEIVGYGEGDPNGRRISYESPVGRALLAMQVGETKRTQSQKGPVEYEVIRLYSSWEEADNDNE